MRSFKKRLQRVVTVRSSDPAIASAKWVVELSERGVRFRRFCGSDAVSLSWRAVIGYGLVHRKEA